MNWDEIVKAIEDYEKMSADEALDQLEPLVESTFPQELAERIGCTTNNVARIARRKPNNEKPTFVMYAKIMSYANDGTMRTRNGKWQRGNYSTEEEKRKRLKAYNHKYYLTKTKAKRKAKREEKEHDARRKIS